MTEWRICSLIHVGRVTTLNKSNLLLSHISCIRWCGLKKISNLVRSYAPEQIYTLMSKKVSLFYKKYLSFQGHRVIIAYFTCWLIRKEMNTYMWDDFQISLTTISFFYDIRTFFFLLQYQLTVCLIFLCKYTNHSNYTMTDIY